MASQQNEPTSTTEMILLRNYDERILKPNAPIAIISDQLDPVLSDTINFYLNERRAKIIRDYPEQEDIPGYFREDYRIPVNLGRYASGEGMARILESVRGHDLFIITDVLNYGRSYTRFNQEVSLSPDEHFEDLCRLITAAHGVARRINVIMPYLYQGRRYRRESRESLDCSVMLKRLFYLGINHFLTFDAHDDRIANAVPTKNFESVQTSLQLIEALLSTYQNLTIDKDHFMITSADEASIKRCVYYASVMKVPLGIFYRQYDPRLTGNGQYSERYLKRNANKAFLGDNVAGKDILIVDDMIDTGKTVLECAAKLKAMQAKRIFVAVSFAQFSKGLEKFHQAYAENIITKIFATNLSYRPPELLQAEWFHDVDVAEYLALLIDGFNHNASLSRLIDPNKKINELINTYKNKGDCNA